MERIDKKVGILRGGLVRLRERFKK